MVLRLFACFIVFLMILSEGSLVKVHPGGNTTLSCSITDDTEINWIITNGNQTFVRIMRLENNNGPESKPEATNIHSSYAGRVKAVSSSTNTHCLLLMNITDSDLLLYCCTDYKLNQTHCTKLEYEDVITEDTDTVSHDPVMINLWLPVVYVFLLLVLLATVCVCWRGTGLQKGCGVTDDLNHQNRILTVVQGEKRPDDWTLAEVLYTPILSNTY